MISRLANVPEADRPGACWGRAAAGSLGRLQGLCWLSLRYPSPQLGFLGIPGAAAPGRALARHYSQMRDPSVGGGLASLLLRSRAVGCGLILGSVSPQLVEIYGHDVHVFLFRSLINHLDLKSSKPPTDQTRLQLLTQELGAVMTRYIFPRSPVRCIDGRRARRGPHVTLVRCAGAIS